MRRDIFALILCALFLAYGGCAQTKNGTNSSAGSTTNPSSEGTAKPPPTDVVRAEPMKLEIKAGSSAEASLKLTITNGYHINANPASFPYLKATKLEVQPGEGITAGAAIYPASVTRTFKFSKEPLAVYEGEVTIKLPLTAAASATTGPRPIQGKVLVQACDEEACYPPRTIEISIPLTIK